MASPMPPKTIKKNSSAKRRPSQGARPVDITPRRRTVPSVEELFTKIFHLSPYPIGITDLETGRCLDINDACLDLFGFQRDEVIGQPELMPRIWPEAQERSRLIDRVKSDGTVRNLEVAVRLKCGEIRHVLISVNLIGLGGKHYLVTTGHDITERKQAEEALRRSEERWQLAATGTTDGIWDWDVTGHTVFLSPRWKQVRGYREDEIGTEEVEWSSRIHPEDFSRVMATVQSYFNKEIPTFECEYRTRRKDGTYYWVNDRGIAVWDTQGHVIRMVGSETDITERKRAEAELQHSEEQFRTVVESAPNGILLVDGGGRIVLGNGQIERQFGYCREELIGHPVEMLVPGRFRKEHAGLREAYHGVPEVRAMGLGRDLYGLRKDGSEFPIEIGLSPIETISGTMVLAAIVDTTKRKRAEQALQESEERYAMAVRGTQDGIWDWNILTKEDYLSPRWKAMLGFAEDELPNHDDSFFARLHPDDVLRVQEAVRVHLQNRVPYNLELRLQHKDGSYRWFQSRGQALWDINGRPVRMAGFITDITERKRAEMELCESEERFRAFTSATSEVVYRMSPDWTEMRQLQGREFIPNTIEPSRTWLNKYIPVDDQQYVMATIQRAIQSKSVFELEHRVIRADGSLGWTYSRAIPMLDDRGVIVEWFGAASDVTQRKRTEEALRQLNATLEQRVTERTLALQQSEGRFRSFLSNASNLAFMKACDGRYLYVNRRFEEAFQLEENEIIGKTDVELFSREQAELFQGNDHRVLAAGKAVEFEEAALYADGRHTSIVVKFPLRDGAGQVYAIGGIVTDITDRKKTELMLQQNQLVLQEQRQELQRLTAQLLTAQDSERQRIARDLHDDFGQRLVALVLDVAVLERNPPLMPELLSNSLESVREELAQLSNDLRQLAHRLHPSLLKHAGLQAALEEFVQHAMQRTGLHIKLKINNVPDSLPHNLVTCLFLVCQESLQNVAKHAKATDVLVKLSGSSRMIGLSVTDNGTGFDVQDKSRHQKGMGLISMQERLRLLNGCLNIHSRAANGTKVCAWIPF